MRKKQIGIGILALLIAITTSGALAVDRPGRFEKPEVVVAWLYRDFGWEALISDYFEKDSLRDQPYSVLARYFTNELSQLLIQRRKREISTGVEWGRIDFFLLFGTQNPDGIGNLRIEKKSNGDVVTVIYDQNTNGDVMEMQFDALNTRNGWRISNIHYQVKRHGVSSGHGVSLIEYLSNEKP